MENKKSNVDKNEDYSPIYKLLIIILWWKEIQNGDWNLKEHGYIRKYRSRIIYILIGIFFYTVIILCASLC